MALHDAGRTTPDTALVIGASGFIGTHLARRLHAMGLSLVCLDLKAPREMLEGIIYLTGDVRDLSAIALDRVDTLWNLAAIHTTPGHPDHEYYDTNVQGAIEVARLAERLNVRDIVFTSSISVYGPSEDRKTEQSRPAPTSAYGKSKLMAEQIHQTWQAGAEGRRLTIVRPAVVFGEGEGGNFARMAALLKAGVFVFPGRRDTVKSCIQVEDLIDLALAARDSDDDLVLLNGAYAECPTLEQIVKTLQTRHFTKARLLDVPRPVVMAAARILGALNGLGGFHPDRVTKLVRSTHVYPGWAADHGLLASGAFDAGIERWARSTDGKFV